MQTMTTGQFSILEVVPNENTKTEKKEPYKVVFPSDMRIGTYQKLHEDKFAKSLSNCYYNN